MINCIRISVFYKWKYHSFACKCGRFYTPKEAFKESKVVFEGVVKSRYPVLIRYFGEVFPVEQYVFYVKKLWKGEPCEYVKLIQGISNCHPSYFIIGESYLVYATKDCRTGPLSASQCLPTKLSEEASLDFAQFPKPIFSRSISATFSDSFLSAFMRRIYGAFLIGISVSLYTFRDPFSVFGLAGLSAWLVTSLFIFVAIFFALQKKLIKSLLVIMSGLLIVIFILVAIGYFHAKHHFLLGYLLR
jgi:hypothetical protein